MSGERERLSAVSALGLVGISFGSVLVIANIRPFEENASTAANFFAVCIPLGTGAYVANAVLSVWFTTKWLKATLTVLYFFSMVIAQFGCAIGLYWLFRHISDLSGQLFLWTAVGCYVAIGVLTSIGISHRLNELPVKQLPEATDSSGQKITSISEEKVEQAPS
jgi:hypothetical protein